MKYDEKLIIIIIAAAVCLKLAQCARSMIIMPHIVNTFIVTQNACLYFKYREVNITLQLLCWPVKTTNYHGKLPAEINVVMDWSYVLVCLLVSMLFGTSPHPLPILAIFRIVNVFVGV